MISALDEHKDFPGLKAWTLAHIRVILPGCLEYRMCSEKAILFFDQYYSMIVDCANNSAFRHSNVFTITSGVRRNVKNQLVGISEKKRLSSLYFF